MRTLTLTLLLLCAAAALGQQYDVSDVQAAELVLMTTCTLPEHTKHEINARQAHLDKLKFVDRQGLGVILTQHCQQYRAMIDRHNNAIDAALKDSMAHHRDWTPGLDQEFMLEKNALVWATLDRIKAAYPAEYDGFFQHIQSEKEYMAHPDEGAMMTSLGPEYHRPNVNAYQRSTGQAGNYTDYGYTTYLNLAWDGYNMYVTAGIVGSSSNTYWCTWDQYHGQWQPPSCASIYHQASTASFSIVGGSPTPDNELYNDYGPQLNPNAYYSWSDSNAPSGWNFYGPVMTNGGPNRPKLSIGGWINVFCSVAQSMIISWPIKYSIMEAHTKGNIPSNTNQTNVCAVQNWCTAATTPPYYNFKKITLVPSTNQCYKNGGTFWDGYEIYTSVSGTGNKSTWRDTGVGWAFQADAYPGSCDVLATLPTP